MEEFNIAYNIIYFSAAIIGLFFALSLDVKKFQWNRIGYLLSLFFLLLLAILVGWRSEDVGTDTIMYSWQYNHVEHMDDREPVFKSLIRFLNVFSSNHQVLLVVMAVLFYSLFAIFLRYRNENVNTYLLFLFFLSLFSFKSLGINIIRQGVSLMFLLNAYNYYMKKKWTLVIFFSVFSLFFHLTSLLPLILFISAVQIRNVNFALSVFVFSLLLAAFNIGIVEIFSLLPFLQDIDPRFGYIENRHDADYQIGFRLSFVIFNTVFLAIALYVRKNLSRFQSQTVGNEFDNLLVYFSFTSALFFLAFQIPFSDRWGIFSWMVIPLLCEPLISSKSKNKYSLLLVIMFISLYSIFTYGFN